MDRRSVWNWAAALSLVGAVGSAAHAGAITFTGNVSADFPNNVPGNGVTVIPGIAADSIPQASFITQNGWTTGWAIKDIRTDYNQATNTMQVGVNFYSIAGQADGNPAGVNSPGIAAAQGSAPPHIGGLGSITVQFASDSSTNPGVPGTPVIDAGVPSDKSQAGPGTDGFSIAKANSSLPIQSSYGVPMPLSWGNLAFDPSPAHPDFEFTIKNWSQFASLAGAGGFWIRAYAGSPTDVVAGESNLGWVHIAPAEQTVVPEPTTLAGWSLLAGSAAWALRRSRRASNRA